MAISKFNQRETYIVGDYRAAYTTGELNVQVAIPNIKNVLQKDELNSTSDFASFYSAASYKFYFPAALDGLGVEPKVALRGVDVFKNILNLGEIYYC